MNKKGFAVLASPFFINYIWYNYSKKLGVTVMEREDIFCPKCSKRLNDFELNKLWCSECDSRFENVDEIYKFNTLQKEIQEKKNNFIIITGNHFEGYRITKYCNLISSEIVLGTGAFSELSGKINDVLGQQSNTLESKLKEAKEKAVSKIIESAVEINSNAIVGFKYNIFSLSGGMISVSAYGTAVIVSKNEDN